jgi:hypothetical protein
VVGLERPLGLRQTVGSQLKGRFVRLIDAPDRGMRAR